MPTSEIEILPMVIRVKTWKIQASISEIWKPQVSRIRGMPKNSAKA